MAPLSIEFSRQEYWSGLSFPSPGDLPNLGNEPRSPSLQGDSLPFKSQREAQLVAHFSLNVDSFGGRTDTAEGQEAIAQL